MSKVAPLSVGMDFNAENNQAHRVSNYHSEASNKNFKHARILEEIEEADEVEDIKTYYLGTRTTLYKRYDKQEKDRRLFKACSSHDIAEIDRLLRHGASVFATDESGCTALIDVADNKGDDATAAEIAQVLLDAGSNPNALTNYNSTPLHWSSFHGKILMSTRLLENGANPNLQNTLYKECAMHHACYRGPVELVLLLVVFGANIYLKDIWGRTPLDYCERGTTIISRQLVTQAYALESTWLRRKEFVMFITAMYGSAQATQARLPDDESDKVSVQSTDSGKWRTSKPVFYVCKLYTLIASFVSI
jgi:ankyrin repeat protein